MRRTALALLLALATLIGGDAAQICRRPVHRLTAVTTESQ